MDTKNLCWTQGSYVEQLKLYDIYIEDYRGYSIYVSDHNPIQFVSAIKDGNIFCAYTADYRQDLEWHIFLVKSFLDDLNHALFILRCNTVFIERNIHRATEAMLSIQLLEKHGIDWKTVAHAEDVDKIEYAVNALSEQSLGHGVFLYSKCRDFRDLLNARATRDMDIGRRSAQTELNGLPKWCLKQLIEIANNWVEVSEHPNAFNGKWLIEVFGKPRAKKYFNIA